MVELKFAHRALHLKEAMLAQIVEHCLSEAPFEACGVLSGLIGGVPLQWHPMQNAISSRGAYSFQREEQLALYRALDEQDRAPLVIYHSHVHGVAVPSMLDVEMAADPNILHLIIALERIVSAAVSQRSVIQVGAARVWRIDGDCVELPIQLD